MNFFEASAALFQKKIPFVVVTMVSARGHTPQDPGAKAVVTNEGLYWGTVGGGKVEARAIAHAKEILTTPNNAALPSPQRTPQLLTWNLQRDIGMTCGGEVTYLFETHNPARWSIAVFGAGHVAQALVSSLTALSCTVTCIDNRAEWVEKLPSSPQLTSLCLSQPQTYVANLPQGSFFVVMTQGHASDVPILEQIFRTHPNVHYVGVIGSKLKGAKIKSELRELGIDEESLNRLRCPIGLDLGTNDPAEIAISIAAELIQVRDRIWPKANSSARDV